MVLPFQALMFLSTMVTLAVLLLPRSGGELVHLLKYKPALFWKMFFANAIQSGLGTCLSIVGIALTNAINAGFLVKLSTVTTTLFAWVILKERMSLRKMIVILTALSGAYLLTTKGMAILPQIGDIFILLACFCWSLGNVTVRSLLKQQAVNPDVVTIQKPLAGAPIFLGLVGFSMFYSDRLGNLGEVLACCSFSTNFLPYALASGFCLAMAWIFLYRTLNVSTASYMTLMSMVTPIFVSILAMILLGERLIGIQVVGAGMILLSGVMVSLSDISSA